MPVDDERDDAAFVLRRRAEDSQAGNIGEQLVGVPRERQLVGADALHADLLQILNRFAQADRRHDHRRAGFELVRQVGRREAFGRDALDHAAAAQEGRHPVEQVLAAIEHADARGPEHLVPAEGQEIGVPGPHVDRLVRHGLRRVDQHDGAGGVGHFDDLVDRVDRAQHVRNGRDGDELRPRRQQPLEGVQVELIVVGDRRPADRAAGALRPAAARGRCCCGAPSA